MRSDKSLRMVSIKTRLRVATIIHFSTKFKHFCFCSPNSVFFLHWNLVICFRNCILECNLALRVKEKHRKWFLRSIYQTMGCFIQDHFSLCYPPVHISGAVLLNHSPTFPQNSVILNILETMRFLTLQRPPLPVPGGCNFLWLTGWFRFSARGALHFRFRKKLEFCPIWSGSPREGWDTPD